MLEKGVHVAPDGRDEGKLTRAAEQLRGRALASLCDIVRTGLRRICSNFTYVPSISRPREKVAAWDGETGCIQDLWKRMPLERSWRFRPSPDDSHVFVCGNPGMIEDMVEILEGEGFKEHKKDAPGQIHVERYW